MQTSASSLHNLFLGKNLSYAPPYTLSRALDFIPAMASSSVGMSDIEYINIYLFYWHYEYVSLFWTVQDLKGYPYNVELGSALALTYTRYTCVFFFFLGFQCLSYLYLSKFCEYLCNAWVPLVVTWDYAFEKFDKHFTVFMDGARILYE